MIFTKRCSGLKSYRISAQTKRCRADWRCKRSIRISNLLKRTISDSAEIIRKYTVDDFDEFAEKIKKLEIEYVHPVKEHGWGQRVVRFYDPDKHIVEVGENMQFVCKRFKAEGMTPGQIAKRMDVPTEYVNNLLKQKE